MLDSITNSLTTINSSATSAANSEAANRNGTTKDQFLKLLVAQLKNQDPLDAPDANALGEQLTQFGQLEQLMNLNDSMSTMARVQSNTERSQAVSLIGKSVDVRGDSLTVSADNKGSLGVNLAGNADKVTLEVFSSDGAKVRTLNHLNVTAGNHMFEFDGLSDGGQPLSDGTYRFTVNATTDGEPVKSNPLSRGVVTAVDFNELATLISIAGSKYTMDQVLSVNND